MAKFKFNMNIRSVEKVETIHRGGHADVPGEAVIINKASISE